MAKRVYKKTKLTYFLIKAREAMKLKQENVIAMAKGFPPEYRISQGFLSRVEKGSLPNPYKLWALCFIYKIDAQALFDAIRADPLAIPKGSGPAGRPAFRGRSIGRRPYDKAWGDHFPTQTELDFVSKAISVLRVQTLK